MNPSRCRMQSGSSDRPFKADLAGSSPAGTTSPSGVRTLCRAVDAVLSDPLWITDRLSPAGDAALTRFCALLRDLAEARAALKGAQTE